MSAPWRSAFGRGFDSPRSTSPSLASATTTANWFAFPQYLIRNRTEALRGDEGEWPAIASSPNVARLYFAHISISYTLPPTEKANRAFVFYTYILRCSPASRSCPEKILFPAPNAKTSPRLFRNTHWKSNVPSQFARGRVILVLYAAFHPQILQAETLRST